MKKENVGTKLVTIELRIDVASLISSTIFQDTSKIITV